MNKRTTVYLWTVTVIGILVLTRQPWSSLVDLPHEHIKGALVLVALAAFAEVLPVMYTVGSQKASSSIAFLPLFACVLLFPFPVALVCIITSCAVSQLIVQRKPLLRASFNTMQCALALVGAKAVFSGIGGATGLPLPNSLLSLQGFATFAAMAGVFFFINQLFVAVGLTLITGDRLPVVFNRVIGSGGANLLSDVLVSPIAIVVAILYSYMNVAGLVVVALPLLIIRHSYAATIKLQQANKDLLAVLIKTIETRDPYTSGHSIRVSILARTIAEDMGLSASVVDRVETAGLVHDIGKVDSVYASIIRKEGALTDSERRVIVTHAAKGAEFLKTLSSFREDIIRGVRHHHERFDGTGYPDGLRGEQIPLTGRIIQLCDSIDAMLSDRPYRKALTIDSVRAELLRCAGTQFDPRIVEIILKRNTLERAAALVRPETGARALAVTA